MRKFIVKIIAITYCYIAMLYSTSISAKEPNDSKVCNLLQKTKPPYGLIVDEKTGEPIKDIDLGVVNYKDFKHFTPKPFRLIVTPKRLIPHPEELMKANIKFVKVPSKLKCKSTTEFVFTIYLESPHFESGKFTLDYPINLEDPQILDSPDGIVTKINSKLTGTFIGND